MRLVLAGYVLAAVLTTTARAEGGVPGSPHAVLDHASTAVAPPDEPPAQAAPTSEWGGALFSPFAVQQRATRVKQEAPLARDPASTVPDSTWTMAIDAVAGLATVAALWIFGRILQA